MIASISAPGSGQRSWQVPLLEAQALLEACPRGQLNLAVLISLQRLLLPSTNPHRGRLRDAAAVIRLDGQVQCAVPDPVEAFQLTEETLQALDTAIASGAIESDPVGTASAVALRLLKAHPFADGNGRVARAVANWILHLAGYRLKSDPQNYCRRRKSAYYQALAARQALSSRVVVQDGWRAFFADLVGECYEAPSISHD